MYIHMHPDLYNIWKEIYVIKNKCMCYGNRSNGWPFLDDPICINLYKCKNKYIKQMSIKEDKLKETTSRHIIMKLQNIKHKDKAIIEKKIRTTNKEWN